MAAPTVIKWTDVGVPALSRTAGSLIALLDYCLPQRGWVKEFSGTNKAVYRAGTGERKFYRVLNDETIYVSASYPASHALISGFDAMTDVDTGSGAWGTGYVFVAKAEATTTARPWVCIVHEAGFWVITCPVNDASLAVDAALSAPCYIGETVPMLPGETPRNVIAGCFLAAARGSLISSTGVHSVAATTDYVSFSVNRSINGTASAVKCFLSGGLLGGSGLANTTSVRPFGNWSRIPAVYDYPFNGEALVERPFINDTVAYSMGDYLPGLYVPCHRGSSLSTFAVASNMLQLRTGTTAFDLAVNPTAASDSLGGMFIDISENYPL